MRAWSLNRKVEGETEVDLMAGQQRAGRPFSSLCLFHAECPLAILQGGEGLEAETK